MACLRHALHTMVPASRSAPRPSLPARTLCARGGRVCCGPGRQGAARGAGGGWRLREGLMIGLRQVRQALVHAWLPPQLQVHTHSARAPA